jgi:hypothetical protein
MARVRSMTPDICAPTWRAREDADIETHFKSGIQVQKTN